MIGHLVTVHLPGRSVDQAAEAADVRMDANGGASLAEDEESACSDEAEAEVLA